MKHRVLIVFFVIFAAVLAAFFVLFGNSSSQKSSFPMPQMVTPLSDNSKANSLVENSLSDVDEEMTSFLSLSPDETLVNTLTLDLDSDMQDDQICLVRKVTSPYLYLLVGVYNPSNGEYERVGEILTPITQAHTFSYAGLDVLGNHQIELVYQGITDSGDSILQIYRLEKRTLRNRFNLQLIGDFKSDGSIFVQQQPRSQAYELSQIDAAPFTVLVSSSDPEARPDTYDQLQTQYVWDSRKDTFVQSTQTKVSGQRIAAHELSKIQDGTVKTFAHFLDGLWYKTTNDGSSIRYLFFDYENSEVILQLNDSEEVYLWIESYLNNSGMYLSTENLSISNLHRRYYISLVGTDEIRLRIQEDLGMTISESNLWDGNYKKMNSKSSVDVPVLRTTSADFLKDFTSGSLWYSADEIRFSFSENKYSISGDLISETGTFSTFDIGSIPVIMFRADSSTPYMKTSYQLSYGMTAPETTGTSRSRTPPQPTIDHNTIILQAVTITPQNCIQSDEAPITLTRSAVSATTE